jgi:hypothetical protein
MKLAMKRLEEARKAPPVEAPVVDWGLSWFCRMNGDMAHARCQSVACQCVCHIEERWWGTD